MLPYFIYIYKIIINNFRLELYISQPEAVFCQRRKWTVVVWDLCVNEVDVSQAYFMD